MSESRLGSAVGVGTTGERYETRERVHDRNDPHGILVVLETVERRADCFELVDGVTVASVNADYPASDRVVLCMYERDLDRVYPEWRWMSTSELRRQYRVEYDQCPPGIHALPSSRLSRYVAGNYTERMGMVVCENCGEWSESKAAWLEHIAQRCPYGDE